MGMLIGGFSIIMGIAFILVLVLMFSNQRQHFRMAYRFVIGYFIFFTLAISHALNVSDFDVNHLMASE